jgi:hypothetical protein
MKSMKSCGKEMCKEDYEKKKKERVREMRPRVRKLRDGKRIKRTKQG